jgi:hypothetical protein
MDYVYFLLLFDSKKGHDDSSGWVAVQTSLKEG